MAFNTIATPVTVSVVDSELNDRSLADYAGKVMDVANAPGEQIGVGELDKAFEILANGGDIDYVGASGVELIGPGEAAGNYRQIEIDGGEIKTVQFR